MKLFEKNAVMFSVILIVIYVVGSSLAEQLSALIGMQFLAEMIFCGLLLTVLFLFIRRSSLVRWLGLQKPQISASKMLFYIPLMLTAAGTAAFGLGMEFPAPAIIFRTVMMVFVGTLEEIIFRGFLFRSIAEQNLRRAVIISSLTFGIGHIVNLLRGAALTETILQIVFAVAVGFVLVFVFLHTGSIVPCIVFHALNNCMTAFATGKFLTDRLGETNAGFVMLGIRMFLIAGYLLYISRLPKRDLPAR